MCACRYVCTKRGREKKKKESKKKKEEGMKIYVYFNENI